MKFMNIIIAYNNHDEICNYLIEIRKQKHSEEFLLIIVVNSLIDISMNMFEDQVKKIFKNIRIFNADKNIGYLNGFLFGYQMIKKEIDISTYKWILLSNTDIKFSNVSTIRDFYSKVYEKDIWAVGPSIYNYYLKSYDNPQKNSRPTISNLKFRRFIFSHVFAFQIFELLHLIKNKIKNKKLRESSFCYAIHGAFMFLNVELIEKLSLESNEIFLYGEELFISEVSRMNNKTIFYDNSFEIIHFEHQTTNLISKYKQNKMKIDSLDFIIKNYY